MVVIVLQPLSGGQADSPDIRIRAGCECTGRGASTEGKTLVKGSGHSSGLCYVRPHSVKGLECQGI